ncbi:gamma-aminobutyric acid receptor alpha-like, partial [Paramuricea clavata]
SEIQEHIDEQARVAKLLLENYDKRFIPTKHGKPLTVTIDVTIADILKIDDMEVEMLIYIRQRWYDFRLSWNSTMRRLKMREYFQDKIWLPDVRIINMKDAKRFQGFGEVNTHIHPDGKVYFSQTVLVKTSCPMDLHTFPLDRQTCFLNFSSFAYGRSLLNYTTGGKHVVVGHTKLPQFDLVETREIEGESKSPGITISLTFQRRFGYYLMSVYIPSASIVLLSWLVFFMEPSHVGDRIALEITLTLTIVFLLDGINKSIIHVSYPKASDVFVIVSFGFILLALLETMLVFRLSIFFEKKQKRRCSCDVS